MTEEQIVMDWLGRKSNRDTLIMVAYPPEVFNFIVDTCSVIDIDNERIYKVNNDWQKITFSSSKQLSHE